MKTFELLNSQTASATTNDDCLIVTDNMSGNKLSQKSTKSDTMTVSSQPPSSVAHGQPELMRPAIRLQLRIEAIKDIIKSLEIHRVVQPYSSFLIDTLRSLFHTLDFT